MIETVPFRTQLKITLIIIGLLCILGYIIFQARFLIAGPRIVLSNQPELLQNERLVSLTGSTHNITRLWLNDRQIYTDASGKFDEALVLENGYTVATLRAEDRYGRSTSITTPLVYSPASFIR